MHRRVLFSVVAAVVSSCSPAATKLPGGFSTVIARPAGPGSHVVGTHLSLTLDGDDLPMLAYIETDPNGDGDGVDSALFFTRWSNEISAWTAPVPVATTGDLDTNGGVRQVSLARDPSTGRIGIAFQKVEAFCNGSNPDWTIHLALSTDDGGTWSTERVSEAHYTNDDPVLGVEVCGTAHPSLAMADGTIHLAYYADWGGRSSGLTVIHGGYYATRTATGAFAYTALPAIGDTAGASMLSLALDSQDMPAIAYVLRPFNALPPETYNVVVAFWRPGGTAVEVVDSNDVQNDVPVLALAFDGTSPRIAYRLLEDAADTLVPTWLSFSDDGVVWQETRIPSDGGDSGATYMDLEIDRAGDVAFVYEFSGGSSPGPGTCGGPKIVRSDADLAAFTACGADDATHQFLGVFVSAATTRDGRLILAFRADYDDEAAPTRFVRGIVLFSEP